MGPFGPGTCMRVMANRSAIGHLLQSVALAQVTLVVWKAGDFTVPPALTPAMAATAPHRPWAHMAIFGAFFHTRLQIALLCDHEIAITLYLQLAPAAEYLVSAPAVQLHT